MPENWNLIHRPSLKSWSPGSTNWSLHFNDLRPLEANAAEATLRELKMLALFDDVTLIRDADIVNHLEVLKIFRQDIDNFQSAIRAGIFVFPIRADAASFTEVNERAAYTRAYPERFTLAAEHLLAFDKFLAEAAILTPSINRKLSSATFPTLLRRILPSLRRHPYQHELLERALGEAEAKAIGSHVRFGDIYSILDKETLSDVSDVKRVIQWCRAAHVLTVPVELGLSPTSADHDLSPGMIAAVLGHQLTESNIRKSSWFERYPQLIPDDEWIESLTFEAIVRLRDRGFEVGYFDSLAALQALDQNDAAFDSAYENYLVSLSGYLKALEWETKAAFVNWQEAFANDRAKLRKEQEAYIFRVPVAIGLASFGLFLTHHSPVASAISGGAASVAELAKAGWDRYRLSHPEPIAALLSKGSTRTPAKVK